MKAQILLIPILVFTGGSCTTDKETGNRNSDEYLNSTSQIESTAISISPVEICLLVDKSYSTRYELPVVWEHFIPLIQEVSETSVEIGFGCIGNLPMPLIRLSLTHKPEPPAIVVSGNVYADQQYKEQYNKAYSEYTNALRFWSEDSAMSVSQFHSQINHRLDQPKDDTLSSVYAMVNRASIFLCEQRPQSRPDVRRYLIIVSDGKNDTKLKTELDKVECSFTTLIVNGEKNTEHMELAPSGLYYFENISGALDYIIN